MPLLNYTTKVPVSRTAPQIQAKLVEHGAKAVMFEYAEEGKISALAFTVATAHGELAFRLPIDYRATLKVLERQASDREIPLSFAEENQAYRVAWRIIKNWVEAQMSLFETEMVHLEEIFLPYLVTGGGKTMYQVMAEKRFLLGPGEGDKR